MTGFVGAVIAPATPLLLPGTGGTTGNGVVADLLERVLLEVQRLQALSPLRWVVVGAADSGAALPPAVVDPREIGAVVSSIAPWPGRRSGSGVVPQSCAVGLHLLSLAGIERPVVRAVPVGLSAADCAGIGAEVAEPGTALLVVADGAARRTRQSPGDYDERAEPFDDLVENALATGDPVALAGLDRALADAVSCRGREALQVLAGAVEQTGRRPVCSPAGLLATAPLGLRYWVTSWT